MQLVVGLDELTDYQLGKVRPEDILAALAREGVAVFRPGLFEQMAAANGPRRRVLVAAARKASNQPTQQRSEGR